MSPPKKTHLPSPDGASERAAFVVKLRDETASVRNPDHLLEVSARLLAEHLGASRCAYGDLKDDEDTFNLTGDYNCGVTSLVGRYQLRTFGNECLRLLRAGETFVVEDTHADPRVAAEVPAYREAQIRAVVCVPEIKNGHLVSAWGVHQNTARMWTAEEIEIIETTAAHSWGSIDRIRANRGLEASEQRYRFLTQSIPQMVWSATPAGALDYVSAQVTRYFNTSEETVLGEGWLQWVHPEDQITTVERWKHSLTTGEPYEVFFRLLRARDHSWRWHLVRAESLEAGPGQIVKWFGTCTDIEDQKKSEGKLAEQARIAALGADVGRALTVVSTTGEALQQCAQAMVTNLDAAFARIWTLSAKEEMLEVQASAGLYTHIDGGPARVPVGSFKIGRIARLRRPHLTNDVAHEGDASDPDWAAREGMVAFAGYPLVVEERLIGVLDLFARHRLGEDTLTALASIAATVAIGIERKRSEEELARYAGELKRSNEDLEQFAQVASHDLRSPLNTVLQFTDLIVSRQGAGLDGELQNFLKIVRDSAKRMAELISALMIYSRLNDADTATVQPISSRVAFENAVENLRAQIDDAQAVIESDDLPEVLSNPNQLLQVIQNLISNAIHYRGEEAPRVRVTAQRHNGAWLFSVSDNGPGIAPRYHSVIFEPFKRLHGTERPGSGIGLAFCRKFIEREGGRIWVESEEGRGSTFHFTLAAVERAAADAD